MFPHNAIKTNTIFEVVKASGGRTAWADKHPAYDLVNGPSGKGVDDLYTPEITNVEWVRCNRQCCMHGRERSEESERDH